MNSKVASLRNKAEQMKERTSDIKDRNLQMIQMEEERNLRVKYNERTLQELPNCIRKKEIQEWE